MAPLYHLPDRSTRRLYVGLLANFALFGTTMTLVGATLPRLIRELHWSYTASGAVLSAGALGYFVSTFVVGMVIHRLGSRAVLLVGLVLQTAGLLVFARHPAPGVNMLLTLCIGIGQGCIEVVTNLGVIRMEREGESRLMNLAHAAFCVGGVLGPLAVGGYLGLAEQWGWGWRMVYPAAGSLLLVMMWVFLRLEFPPEPDAEPGVARGPAGASLALAPLLGLFALILLLYVSAEIGFSNWASEYFVDVLAAEASTGALMVSTLWLGVLAGRLALSLWYSGDRQDLAIFGLSILSTLSVVLLHAARSLPVAALAVLLAGLGYSGVYPMVMTLVGRWFRSGRAVGIVSTGGGIGSFAFPLLMGYLGERLGIRDAFLICAVASGAVTLLAIPVIAARSRIAVLTQGPIRGRDSG